MENEYLIRAMEKHGLVVIVRSYSESDISGRRKIEYVSESTDIVGINRNMLLMGYKLPMDYVHPEDRETFSEMLSENLPTRTDFTYPARLIGDDGNVRNVIFDILYIDEADTLMIEYVVSYKGDTAVQTQQPESTGFIGGDSTEIKKAFKTIDTAGDITDIHINEQFLTDNYIDIIMNSFAEICGVYTVLLDINGKALCSPYGPNPYLGEFYQIVENPAYHEDYERIVVTLREHDEPMLFDLSNGNSECKMAAAPIVVNGVYVATWLIYAHTIQQTQNLFKCYDKQYNVAKALSYAIMRLCMAEQRKDAEDKIRTAMQYELDKREVFSEIIAEIDSTSGDFSKIFAKVANLLEIDYAAYYSMSEEFPDNLEIAGNWSKTGDDVTEKFSWNYDMLDVHLRDKLRSEVVVIDKNTITNRMRVEVFKGNVRAMISCPIIIEGSVVGRVIFADNSRERVWTDSEIKFAVEATTLFTGCLINRSRRSKTPDDLQPYVYELMSNIPVMLFVRDVKTGRVVFSNRMMNDRIGRDITGENSFGIVPNIVDEYVGLEDAASRESTFYQRYIGALGGIFDVTETRIETDSPVSMIVLRTAKTSGH